MAQEVKDEKVNKQASKSNRNVNRKQKVEPITVKEQYHPSTFDGSTICSEAIADKKSEVDITPFISNPSGNVYAITGLPEEFIATLFAWVSRSPKSFKEHLQIALQDHSIQSSVNAFQELDEKAKAFHEKWTVGYGHSSVAEHAVSHVGIEKISRLASAELELANSFLSITEYSQRYQRPERGEWHNPITDVVGKGQAIRETVEDFYNNAFNAFEKLIAGVKQHLIELESHYLSHGGLTPSEISAIEKLAFEDARYVLPLAMYSQLGMTANGRAWRDTIAHIGISKHQEVHNLADDLRAEITKVLPVLLKYATPSQYQINSKKRMKPYFKKLNRTLPQNSAVELRPINDEVSSINQIIAYLIVQNEGLSYASAYHKAISIVQEEKETIIKDLLFEMQHFDTAPDVFKHIRYEASFLVSEANWHQLLRHNRMTDFTFADPTPHLGIKIPPRIKAAGLEHLVIEIAQQSEQLYNYLVEQSLVAEAEYVVLNAHKRHIVASFSLWEAYHLINLRTSEEAQWDIRETFEDLYSQLTAVQPLLFIQAKRRLK